MEHSGETNGIEWESQTFDSGRMVCVVTRDKHGAVDVDHWDRDRAHALIAALQAALAQKEEAA